MDGPLAALLPEWLRRYNIDYEDDLTPDKIKIWDMDKLCKPQCGKRIFDYLRDPNLYEMVKPVEGGLGTFQALKGMGYEVIVATAGVLGNLDQKLDWLRHHGFIEPSQRHMKGVIFTYDKEYIRAQVLIDDGPHNVEKFGGLGIVWDAPYNQDIKRKHYRIKSWADLPDLWLNLYGE